MAPASLARRDIIRKLVDLIGNTSIMAVLIHLIGTDEHLYSDCTDVIQWLRESDVLEMELFVSPAFSALGKPPPRIGNIGHIARAANNLGFDPIKKVDNLTSHRLIGFAGSSRGQRRLCELSLAFAYLSFYHAPQKPVNLDLIIAGTMGGRWSNSKTRTSWINSANFTKLQLVFRMVASCHVIWICMLLLNSFTRVTAFQADKVGYGEIMCDGSYLDTVLADGAKRATEIADNTLTKCLPGNGIVGVMRRVVDAV
ncbi:OLC1v1029119C1 [Oldenlandia corymbosa var. corymbosa]|uniref:OLC1v1029119C1 n=1 Tax=Oldenlandia corymbosa var. corymbosa TaxID=529605 RepID=A0AAV1CDW3_OLDCO|nr:OLC1v1029119C1 [Oldenlandia corymbosa var. corymbosa]